MKIRNLSEAGGRHQLDALSLVEVIGALAVIAVLAISIVPPTINTINWSKALNAVKAYQSLYTAATNHLNAYGSFNVNLNTTNTDVEGQRDSWDSQVLIQEGLIDQAFRIRIGKTYGVHVVAGGQENNGSGYKLDGVNNGTSTKSWVVEIAITNVTPQNANDVSQILDGSALTPTTVGGVDTKGKVTYDGSSIMYMYVIGY